MTAKVIEPSAGDILRQAAALIEEWGLYKHAYLDPKTGSMCMQGAFNAASGWTVHEKLNGSWDIVGHDAWPNVVKANSLLNNFMLSKHKVGVISFSDRADVTKEDVIAAFLEAADYIDRLENAS